MVALNKNLPYEAVITLKQDARLELHWWIENISVHNGKAITMNPPELMISSDASMQRWGAACQEISPGGEWSQEQRLLHINMLELIAVEYAIKTFTRDKQVTSIHLQNDNTCALAYIVNMEGTKNPEMAKVTKSIWSYLLSKEITCTAEYIPSELNVAADWESRQKNSSEWRLDTKIFQEICQKIGTPTADLYISWKRDPKSSGTNAFSQNWLEMFPYAFPPFNLIGKTLAKASCYHSNMIVVTPVWPSQTWYPLLLKMSIRRPLFLPQTNYLLKNPEGEMHPLIQNKILRLAAWLVSGEEMKQRECQNKLITLSQNLGEKEQDAITTQPGRNLVAGVHKQIDPFHCSLDTILNYLANLFSQNYEYRTINNHRSAISAFHENIEGYKIGTHPKVIALLKGVSNERPPRPRYTSVWDVELVLLQIKKMSPYAKLNAKELTLKLTMLLAQTATTRSSELKNLDIKFMTRSNQEYKFQLGETVKHSKQGKIPPTHLIFFVSTGY